MLRVVDGQINAIQRYIGDGDISVSPRERDMRIDDI